MKPVGTQVRLTINSWDGPRPVEGDALRTRTGHCYLIEEIRGRVLVCTVLGHDAVPPDDPGVFFWTWSQRSKARLPS